MHYTFADITNFTETQLQRELNITEIYLWKEQILLRYNCENN